MDDREYEKLRKAYFDLLKNEEALSDSVLRLEEEQQAEQEDDAVKLSSAENNVGKKVPNLNQLFDWITQEMDKLAHQEKQKASRISVWGALGEAIKMLRADAAFSEFIKKTPMASHDLDGNEKDLKDSLQKPDDRASESVIRRGDKTLGLGLAILINWGLYWVKKRQLTLKHKHKL